MRLVIVGYGVQGKKRRAIAGNAVVAIVDPINEEADAADLRAVDPASYDAAYLCVPDDQKLALIGYLLDHGKHFLVEKPLVGSIDALAAIQARARAAGVVAYTAYNHRLEPHFVRMHDLLAAGTLGRLYSLRLFYGNGTARLVRQSPWRDQGAGVLPDLGSHLLDTVDFWLGAQAPQTYQIVSADRFENNAFDSVCLMGTGTVRVHLEMSLLSWRNHFYADVVGEHGSAHIVSLCKWGPSQFVQRTRKLPSGAPDEQMVTLVQPDPTWQLEHTHFLDLCARGQASDTPLAGDVRLNGLLRQLCADALAGAAK
jgi:scyllo-inositol 2-dehydrogenase (NADP+)